MSADQAAASEPVHLVCGHCDTVVRVPRDRFAAGPRCAKCHNPLFEDHPLELKTASFDKHITRSDLPVIVDFWAPWCGPCRTMAPHYEEAARRLKDQARFAKVNSDEEPTVAGCYNIRGIPTLIAFKQGRAADRRPGPQRPAALGWFSGRKWPRPFRRAPAKGVTFAGYRYLRPVPVLNTITRSLGRTNPFWRS